MTRDEHICKLLKKVVDLSLCTSKEDFEALGRAVYAVSFLTINDDGSVYVPHFSKRWTNADFRADDLINGALRAIERKEKE